jgi:CRISPR-associated protein Cmr2
MYVIDYYLSEASIEDSSKNQQTNLGRKKETILNQVRKGKDFRKFYPTKTDLEQLPKNSILIRISFKLKKPYTSKDEGEFHVITDGKGTRIFENPIVRDKFLGCPMVRPSTWKGHIRFAAERIELPEVPSDERKRKTVLRRLFGSEPEDEDNLKGRLHFFPTFFNDDAERDIITPLNRETRTPVRGRSPISLEVMKAGKSGDFYLLYVPYPRGNDFREKHLREDLTFLVEALKLTFYVYGFSAKKTSGFGVIEKQLDKGVVWTKTRTGTKEGTFSEIGELISRLNELWGV